MDNLSHSPLRGWVPRKLVQANDTVACRWLYVDNHLFREPFFDETISRCLPLPENSSQYKCVSSLDVLEDWAKQVESIQPTAFIYHVSRCGSTLVAQMLGLDDGNIVLPEVPFFDEILRLKVKGIEQDEKKIGQLFKAALCFYGAKRTGAEKRLFVKADSWHFLFYEQLRALFPALPFIIMYRAPEEVLYSHERQKGMHAVPGVLEPALFNFSNIEMTDVHNYMSLVLERYYEIILDIAAKDNNVLFINYNEGISAIMDKIAAFTNMPLEDAYKEKILERSHYHAKEPEQVFREKYAPQPLNPPNMPKLKTLYHRINELNAQVNAASY